MGTILPEGLRNAELILPVTTMAEENGTYVNRDRRIQRYTQAKSPPGMARPAWWVAGEVLAGPGPSAAAPSTAAEAFELLGERWSVFASTSYEDIGFTGRVLTEPVGAGGSRPGSRAGVL
jgi:predicted molibdopterin-dependent oxidoreductase YjgC